VYVIRPRVDRPQTPIPVIAVALGFLLDDLALLRRQQNDIVFQAFATPLFETWLRELLAMTPPAPATLISLKVSSIYGPRDEVGYRIVRVHR
jgi:hypothetical protein